MTKSELKSRTDNAVEQIKSALQAVYDSLNQGQRMQLVKVESVKKLFDRYGVKYE